MRFVLLVIVAAQTGSLLAEEPDWIWVTRHNRRAKSVSLKKTFVLRDLAADAQLKVVADFCEAEVLINGKSVARIDAFSDPVRKVVSEAIGPGANHIEVKAKTVGGPSAIAFRLVGTRKSGGKFSVLSNKQWRTPDPDGAVTSFGRLAEEPSADHPDTVTVSPLDDYTQWKQALGANKSASPSSFAVPKGFAIELLRHAQPKEGSWVSLEFDPKGRLIIAREKRGLLRMVLSEQGNSIAKVEVINNTLMECRGLLFAKGSLFANANNSLSLYRLTDTNGDDRFDDIKLLKKTNGGVGHGRNDLCVGPDGKIYTIHGDAVHLPDGASNRRSPLQKNGRAGRHGYVMRIDPNGKNCEVIANGMRNPYGIDFNRDGEMFTYDADAEHDMGSSWYRPTRVLHLVSGSDFGWRAVTGTWPPYDPDVAERTPHALHIGKGSPTSVKFGTQSNYPGKYRDALFILDWAYGRILAAHLTPRGAGYALRAETFIKGRPFNVTDLTFGPDGAMYVTTGGRGTRSALYRIHALKPNQSAAMQTSQQKARIAFSKQQRALRKKLEHFHRPHQDAIAFAWKHLGSSDPMIAHAARIAIEHQPIAQWREEALAEKEPRAAITALLALAQTKDVKTAAEIVKRLGTLDLAKLSIRRQRQALRVFDLVTKADPKLKSVAVAKLDSMFPGDRFAINQPLSTMLVRWEAKRVVPRVLDLLDRAKNQREQFHYLHTLRVAKSGWTISLRERYLRWLAKAPAFVGGAGMPKFIARIRKEASADLSPEDRRRFASLLSAKPAVIDVPKSARDRKFVRKWQLSDFPDAKLDGKRSFERGRRMFHAAACSACHRVQSLGTLIGPDLTFVGRRFGVNDILTAIIEPSKVVAEQYRQDIIRTTGGKTFSGLVLPAADYRSPTLKFQTDPLDPATISTIPKKEIARHRKSDVSIMPAGLVNTLSRDEIADLLAYLISGGNAKHPVYEGKAR